MGVAWRRRGGSHAACAHMTGGLMDRLPAEAGAAAASAAVEAEVDADAEEEAGLPAADLPLPQVSEQRDPEPTQMQGPQGDPLLLSCSLQELLARDTVQVELIPEKKGLFLKHVEYEVSSQRFRSSVYRRYNDFVVFQEVMLQKFPYRMVPALPPKRMLGADRKFIEARRRALRRFINLVARHPRFSEDVSLRLFLSFSGPDVQNQLRESAQCVGDEFMNCKLAMQAKDFLPADIQTQFAVSRELIRNIYNSFYKLRDRAERIASRAIDNAADLLIFGKELSALGSDTTPLPSWAPLSSSTWESLKQALKGLSVEFALLADRAVQQGKQEENNVVEKLNLFLDLLQSYKDLCERHEKGVLHRHQRALHKYSLMKRQMMRAAVQSCEPEAVEQLETRIVEQENAIQTMELRNCFSLYCLHQEMQLVHTYLPLTSHILGAFVNAQIQGHKEMSKVWNDLRSKLPCFFAGQNSNAVPPRSLQDGVSPH
ncbi:sorting nexin-8 isoform X6 [Manis javanica]|uniref:sorting nexin-8 isoform X6 n=1 Tax=Manis javanica TaxID=9974 RepID=UPI00187B08A4|nr:sorting nexin-8 isoform X1 [Manis javanica]